MWWVYLCAVSHSPLNNTYTKDIHAHPLQKCFEHIAKAIYNDKHTTQQKSNHFKLPSSFSFMQTPLPKQSAYKIKLEKNNMYEVFKCFLLEMGFYSMVFFRFYGFLPILSVRLVLVHFWLYWKIMKPIISCYYYYCGQISHIYSVCNDFYSDFMAISYNIRIQGFPQYHKRCWLVHMCDVHH